MADPLYGAPPIQPFNAPPTSSDNPASAPLLFPVEQRQKLAPYLPPPRTTYLLESPFPVSERNNAISSPLPLPHLTLTYAQSLDSQIALRHGVKTDLSGAESYAMTHYLRSQHDVILIGVSTAATDNPRLNCRYRAEAVGGEGLETQPRPIVLDPGRRWKRQWNTRCMELAERGEGRALWLITSGSEEKGIEDEDRTKVLRNAGGDVVYCGEYMGKESGVDWETLLRNLAKTGVRSVMVEGGATVINDLLKEWNQKFVSSVIVTIAPTYLGTGGVLVSPQRTDSEKNEARLEKIAWVPAGEDIVMLGTLKKPS
jgi:2,5-diamino-6-(ribosylamino)-4(3H)-pyrimidinone 5'-phosphate reductase